MSVFRRSDFSEFTLLWGFTALSSQEDVATKLYRQGRLYTPAGVPRRSRGSRGRTELRFVLDEA